MAEEAARRSPGISLRPAAEATRRVAAVLSPRAIINVIDARLRAIWWAASCVAPIQPIMIAPAANASTSRVICKPIEAPDVNNNFLSPLEAREVA